MRPVTRPIMFQGQILVLVVLSCFAAVYADTKCGGNEVILEGASFCGSLTQTNSTITLDCNWTDMKFDIKLQSYVKTDQPKFSVVPLNSRKMHITQDEHLKRRSGRSTCPDDNAVYHHSISFLPDPQVDSSLHTELLINQYGHARYETVVIVTEQVIDVEGGCKDYWPVSRKVRLICEAMPRPTEEVVIVPPVQEECTTTDCYNFPTFICSCQKGANANGVWSIMVRPRISTWPSRDLGWQVAGISSQSSSSVYHFWPTASLPQLQPEPIRYTFNGRDTPTRAELVVPSFEYQTDDGQHVPIGYNCQVEHCLLNGPPRDGYPLCSF